jgi:hypothetical protein
METSGFLFSNVIAGAGSQKANSYFLTLHKKFAL